MLAVDNQSQLEQLLVENALLTAEDLEKHKVAAQQAKSPLLAYLTDQKVIDNEALTKIVAKANNVPYVKLSDVFVGKETLKLLPKDVAERYMAVPLGKTNGRLAVAMIDANNLQAVDFLAKKIDQPIKVFMASEEGIRSILNQYSMNLNEGVTEALEDAEQDKKSAAAAKEGDSDDKKKIKTIVQDSPISRALSEILEYAVQNHASDIHIEPREHDLKIRARIDGILREIMTLPKAIEPALVSRIKILSNLKIDEHRVPQDGQFAINVSKKEIDLRIAISPVVWGEQVVIRILDKSGGMLSLENMGFHGRALKKIREGINRPHGMVLSSGPTGSGKSTTLYALINEIKSVEINIVTLEDPVEYKMDGVNQIQVNADVGLTFASGLRSILRQDPNVVMVGEIRDKETANLAVQAALTGHLVFSTLHTNSAAGILPRLLDMGVEPFLIASTVNTVIGQRLVRRLVDEKEHRESTAPETAAINEALGGLLPKDEAEQKGLIEDLGYDSLPLMNEKAYTLYEGKKTKKNPGGYTGRVGIYEVFNITEEIEKLVINRAPSSEIQKQAQLDGMLTMRQDGYLKALNGQTSIDEVNRVAAEG